MIAKATDWRALACALATALAEVEDELQRDRSDRPCGCADASRGTPVIARAETLSRERAQAMHRELGRLGLSRDEHYSLSEDVVKREVKSLTTLNDAEALDVLNAARRLASQRAAARRMPERVSDEEAWQVLN